MNPRNFLIYISGKYTDDTHEKISQNIKLAREHAKKIWELGFTAICPHLNTMHFEEDANLQYRDYLDGDYELVRRSDGIYMLPNFKNSKGALEELDLAILEGKKVFLKLEDLVKFKNELQETRKEK